ncbi:DUF1989 domain-containing protein [Sciscionella marina]|uniref:DUF1989 domain-containing protein n=1 Tax=Sciscionella marina TaxID=508770 RepID=UPI00035C646E|nr:urea carboxylase-associated family protein [Sciscionella marina]
MTASEQTVVTVPAQSGRATRIPEGASLTIVDVEGQQVGDLWIIDAADDTRWLSTAHTRDRVERLFPRVGEQFIDQRSQPILEFLEDTSPGNHDMLYAPCDRWLYEGEGLYEHPNCLDNFTTAAASIGLNPPVVPDPLNIFQNSNPEPDGTLVVGTAKSRPGDRVTFRALRGVFVVLTACSVDYWPTNGMRCTPLEMHIGRAR